MSQVNTTICTGTGITGKMRLKLYREKIKARGYKSLSKFVRDTLDRDLAIEVPKNKRRETRPAIV